jgi:para-aminobenzoate synthetase component I
LIKYQSRTVRTPSLETLFHLVDKYGGITLFSAGLEMKSDNKELTGINPVIVLTETTLTYGQTSRPVKSPLKELDKLTDALENLPKEIGLLGYLSYDFKDRIEEKGLYNHHRQGIYEDCYFALYEYYYVTTRNSKESSLYKLSFNFPYKKHDNLLPKREEKKLGISSIERTSQTRDTFSRNVEKIISHIKEGEIYQANLTRSVHGKTSSNGMSLALDLASSNRIEYGVFAKIPGGYVISTSPELFFSVEGGNILSSPIKGTTPRGKNKSEDRRLKEELLHSEKNLAELAMITDLMRNDLSRVCEPGSVKVSPFPLIMNLENVFHLYANITGRLSQSILISDIIRALFPGGSITGCPKIRACQIIELLEDKPRGIYTGSFGIINSKNQAKFNIMIRTVFLQENDFFYNVGGGITLLSQGNEEFNETIHKGENICQALKTEELE